MGKLHTAHFAVVKVYVQGDEETEIPAGYVEPVAYITGTREQGKAFVAQYRDEVIPGDVHVELRGKNSGKVYARMTGEHKISPRQKLEQKSTDELRHMAQGGSWMAGSVLESRNSK